MKLRIPKPVPEIAAPQGDASNLIHWLSDPRGQKFFGRAFKLKADVLVALITGDRLSDVSREHQVSPEAAYRYARRARALYPELHTRKR
jgi:hypothetical protein